MRKLKRLLWSFLAMVIFFPACTDDYPYDTRLQESTLTGAREFYEKTISQAASQGILADNTPLSPGDVTPRWQEVSYKQDARYRYMYIPLYTQKSYIKRYITEGKKKKEQLVRIGQYLCIRKEKRTGAYSGAYVTYIPSAGYYAYNKNSFADKSVQSETLYGSFTGHVVYQNFVTGRLLVADKVDRGVYEWSLSRKAVPDKTEFHSRYKRIFGDIHKVSSSRLKMMSYELDEVVVTPENDTYSCVFCGKDVNYRDICSCRDSGFPDEGEDDGGDQSSGGNDYGAGGNGGNSGGSSGSAGSTPSQNTPKRPKTDFREKATNYVPSSTDKFPSGTTRFKWDKKCYLQGDDLICTGCSMNYLNRQLNDDNSIKPQGFIDEYVKFAENQGKGEGTFTGFDMGIINDFVDDYFTIHEFSSFENAIFNEQVVLTWIRLPNDDSHSVVVVGTSEYEGSRHFIYMDSNFGELRMIKESDIEMYLLQLPVSKR